MLKKNLLISVITGLIAIILIYILFLILQQDNFSYKDAARFVLFEPLLLCVVMPLVSISLYLSQSSADKTKRKPFHAFILVVGSFLMFYLFDYFIFLVLPEYATTFQLAFNDLSLQNNQTPDTKLLPIGYQCLFVNILSILVSFTSIYLLIRIYRER